MNQLLRFSRLRRNLLSAAVLGAITSATAGAATGGASAAKASSGWVFQNAPTRFAVVGGVRLAYRRFGKAGGPPLVFFQHFVGNLDGWDPKVVDGLARDREVILFDNAGVGSSEGEVPTTIEEMAAFGIGLLDALNVRKADLLGFSMGSLVAQVVAIERPELVRRVILVGSGPRGGAGMATLTPEFQAMLGKKHDVADELLLDVFFTPSAASQAAGRAFLSRIRSRVDRDAPIGAKVAPAQVAAFAAWGAPRDNANDYLKALKHPVLVVSGGQDIVHYPINAWTLQQHLPNAELVIFPDANHGAIYQYPEQFLTYARVFLDPRGDAK